MKRDSIDLHYVKPEHIDVHNRLLNWGRWSNPRSAGSQMQPMFRGYEPYLVPRNPSGGTDVDVLDAQRVQKAMHLIAEKQRDALAWCYVHPYMSERKMMWRLAVNRQGLQDLLHDGRTMAKNVLGRRG